MQISINLHLIQRRFALWSIFTRYNVVDIQRATTTNQIKADVPVRGNRYRIHRKDFL